jgi:glutathione S-transferase
MKLYSIVPQDRSGKVKWLLYEMGLTFEDIRIDYKKGELQTPEYLAMNPMGQVPVLVDEGEVLLESYAIVQYLADKYPEKKMAPPLSEFKQRARYSQWLFFSLATAEDFFVRYKRLSKMTDDYKSEWGDYIQGKTLAALLTLEKQLEDKEYILGSFSAVDTCLGYAIKTIAKDSFFSDYPRVKGYFERLMKREACIKSEVFKTD